MDYKKEYESWCNNPNFDEEAKQELISIKNDEEEIKDRFYKNLEFGTAGLRGVMGMRNKPYEQIHCYKSNTRTCKFYNKRKWTNKRCCH